MNAEAGKALEGDEIFLGRQPILDRGQQLHAYELLFRSGQQNSAQVEDNLAASANVINHAFADLGVEQALGPYQGFVNCDEALLLSDALEVLPSDKIVLEVLETVDPTPAILERCRELKARGFTLALDDFVGEEEKYRQLLDLVDIVKVDLKLLNPDQLKDTTELLRRWPVKMLAEKVDTRELADHCHQAGYTFFQGYYFARPAIVAGRKLGHSQLALMRLLSLVLQDADTQALETIFKQEPGLTVNLMRLTNSVATGCRVRVTSLRHAISVLGRRQLQRWLQLLLYTNPAGGSQAPSPLMVLAASRGRLMELLASQVDGHDLADQAFMTGILSLMPAVMGVPMDEILKSISLAAPLQAALETGEGPLGHLLRLATALESGDGNVAQAEMEKFRGLSHVAVNSALTEALRWTNSISEPAEEE